MHLNYRLLNDREWSGRYAVALNGGANGVYLSRSNLDAAFDDNGYQVNPLIAQLTGSVEGVVNLFNRCGWHAEPESDASLRHQYLLMARQGISGNIRCVRNCLNVASWGATHLKPHMFIFTFICTYYQ